MPQPHDREKDVKDRPSKDRRKLLRWEAQAILQGKALSQLQPQATPA